MGSSNAQKAITSGIDSLPSIDGEMRRAIQIVLNHPSSRRSSIAQGAILRPSPQVVRSSHLRLGAAFKTVLEREVPYGHVKSVKTDCFLIPRVSPLICIMIDR